MSSKPYFPLQGVQEDIRTLQPNLDNINDIMASLFSNCDENYANELRPEVKKLNERWSRVRAMAAEQNSKLHGAMTDTQGFRRRMAELNHWMDTINRDHLAREYTVHTYEELTDLNEKFQVTTVYPNSNEGWASIGPTLEWQYWRRGNVGPTCIAVWVGLL